MMTLRFATLLLGLALLTSCLAEKSKTENEPKTVSQAVPQTEGQSSTKEESEAKKVPATEKVATTKPKDSSQSSTSVNKLVERLNADKKRVEAEANAAKPDIAKLRAEVDQDIRKLFSFLSTGDSEGAKSGFLSDDEINTYFSAAKILLSRSAQNYKNYEDFRAIVGDAIPQLMSIIHDDPQSTASAGTTFLKTSMFVGRAKLTYLVGGQERTLELLHLLRTDSGWKCLSMKL